MKNYRKYIITLIVLLLTACSSLSLYPKYDDTIDYIECTKEFVPVCGEVKVACLELPCSRMVKTFSNFCVLEKNKQATFLYHGFCKQKGLVKYITIKIIYIQWS